MALSRAGDLQSHDVHAAKLIAAAQWPVFAGNAETNLRKEACSSVHTASRFCLQLPSRTCSSTEPTYDIDKGQLEARYKRLQKDLHPDKFGGRDAQQQEYSAEQSSLVNHAYVKLKSPLQRALYLLERKGKPAPEDGGTISDPVLLMEVMEQRELVEETNDVGILQVMLQENKLLEQATTENLSRAFKTGELEAAERIITDLRYVTRTGEAISKKLP
ncbi:TPA: hypothetical protein ACH3X2_006479 [Trebouxia sp. C0005]